MTKTIGGGDRTDFDETRRLLYMALVATRTKKYNLAGTLVNALTHHHSVDNLDADQITAHVINALEPESAEPGKHTQSRQWLREQIARISSELGD